VWFTRDRSQHSDALSRDPKTALAKYVGRIDAHDPDSTADADGLNKLNQ
jgi:hypothetical protein